MATIIGTSNSETLTGTEFADSILGAGGNDVLNGLAGADTLDGGADNDTLRGGDGNDSLVGGAGKDWLFGDAGDDRLFGGDRLDRLTGGDGHDLLDGGTGDDRLVGGKGNDIYVVDNLQDQATEQTGEGTDEVRTSLLSYSLGGFIENLSFTGTGNFAGTGNGGANRIAGASGNDVLDGAAGNDLLLGGSGRDTLTGADGHDVLHGGSGRDALSGGAGGDTLLGGDFNDVLSGGVGGDTLDGGLGTDTARFSGSKSDYLVRRVGDKIEVIDLNPEKDGADDTDVLSSFEVLQFKDGTLAPPTAIGAIRLAELDGTDGFILRGTYSGDLFGRSVSGGGDINGDGFDDLIVGAPGSEISSDGGEYYYTVGRGHILFGSANASQGLGISLYNNETYSRTGFSVSNAGDVNGDGFADVIVGAPGDRTDYGGDPYGQTYVVFGSATLDEAGQVDLPSLNGTNGFQIKTNGFYDFAGLSVASAGDVNGDGFGDLIVGAPYSDISTYQEGISYVVFGKADWSGTPIFNADALDGTNGFRLTGIDKQDHSGMSVSSAGDVNSDGLDDLIIGAPDAGTNGHAYVVFGKADWTGAPAVDLGSLDGINGFRIAGETGDLIGQSVRSAGDVNGDGIADMIVGAPETESPGQLYITGESYVIFGKMDWAGTPVIDVANLDGSDGFRLVGSIVSDLTGHSVSSAGDVNGDGFDDLVIGAPYAGGGGNAFVVYGKASWAGTPALDLTLLDGTDGFVLIGDQAYDRTGFSVSAAGDVNNDGFDDLIIGAPGADQGRSYVLFGGNFNNAAVPLASADELSATIGSG